MMRVVTIESEVRAAQDEFCKRLTNESSYQVKAWAGFQGGQLEVSACWINRCHYWFSYVELKARRHWNAFGIERPSSGANLSITCEINFPLSGVNRRIAGLLLVDNRDQFLVAHRGKIGGGKKDVGPALFEKNFIGDWISVDDGKGYRRFAVVSALDAPDLALEVGEFVHEVVRIKSLVGDGSQRVSRAPLKAEPARVSRFQIGQRIRHPTFGDGTVRDIEGDKLTIDFDHTGTRKVMEGFVEEGT